MGITGYREMQVTFALQTSFILLLVKGAMPVAVLTKHKKLK